ncbi:RagB/SusD family nutrient uptake outer membrane protein [Chitinophaga nivalis]|uniref:RagB/SusD family nutrient uptake outer membrane protein n=1 Tax=Chitinophaga nivalis TaxID=2991709 RepID=A0ABT3ITN6_9BACT|nr:RagB/SusD family nutrient uptake outer membrane protein [Chitinophaga nivalis]MCW3463030.1 RagB/SusD family nutrient uptake outer membrane protein [Chitinophaga nivalis]MCW3487280.1 RagB/SusD family nutrient uptake outer membrane protein [Chitinophaga nivalis]
MRYPKSFFLLILMTIAGVLTSCTKYLDVQPEDQFLENQVYSSRVSIRNVLNGIYLNLAKPVLYGENLSSTTLDVLAQYYNTGNSGHPYYTTATYKYTDAATMKRTTDIWNNAYTAILNINLFIANLEAGNKVLSEEEKALMLGEAYGLRAFIAFDMLRLFGPLNAMDAARPVIPYPRTPASKIETLLSAASVVANVLEDLTTAVKLLDKDPVRTNGIKTAGAGEDAFFSMRNRRMNYYAVRALTARVLLYKQDKPAALEAATTLINETSTWFPWSPAALSVAGIPNPDRIFSSEVILGLENAGMYTTQTSNFAASLSTSLLAPLPEVLTAVYENYDNDYRYRTNFSIDRTSTKTDKTFFKYADILDKNAVYRKLQPLIRRSELYYIAIECETDDNKATTLLNTVRLNRGLSPATINGNKKELLTKEYQKEFWGEGQLFYYYKRTNQSAIRNGAAANGTITMTATQYVVPLPLSETSFR